MSFLPERDREYLKEKGINFQEQINGNQKAIIFPEKLLPSNVFDISKSDILVVLPAGYDDAAPDMFYAHPWIKLKVNGQYPVKADASFDFNGINWQRWSRHNKEWRNGIDGIWTVIKRIERALAEAK